MTYYYKIGTSATGYAVLASAVVAIGQEFVGRLPQKKQLDWEAMLVRNSCIYVLN